MTILHIPYYKEGWQIPPLEIWNMQYVIFLYELIPGSILPGKPTAFMFSIAKRLIL